MGCVCCSLSSFVSIILQACERVTLCTVCAMLVCCLLFTILSVLVMGIGIGFHYCTVQNSVEGMEKAAKAAGAVRRSGGDERPLLRSMSSAVKQGLAHRMGKRGLADEPMPSNNNTVNDAILAGNITFIKEKNDSIIGGYIQDQTIIRYKREMRESDSNITIINGTYLLPKVSYYSVLNETVHKYKNEVSKSNSLNDSDIDLENFQKENKTLTPI